MRYVLISLILMAILTLLAGYRISQQDKILMQFKAQIDELIKRQITNQKNDKFLYDKMIEHETSIRLLKNGFYK